ncbi:hypothetical protein OG21DRAFT_1486831 [Imleria badia]|nr:hypothetical protein OG21DRAFT_1486831 [Imleria badia]
MPLRPSTDANAAIAARSPKLSMPSPSKSYTEKTFATQPPILISNDCEGVLVSSSFASAPSSTSTETSTLPGPHTEFFSEPASLTVSSHSTSRSSHRPSPACTPSLRVSVPIWKEFSY